MKSIFTKFALAAAVVGTMAAGSAFATPIEMELSSGAFSTGPIDLGSCSYAGATVVCTSSSVTFIDSNFDGWNLRAVSGESNSPLLNPLALDLSSLTAVCVSGGCASDSLAITISDDGFTGHVPLNGFGTFLSSSSQGTVTQNTWGGNSNNYFDESNQIGPTLTVVNGGSAGASGGGPAGPGAFSLTLEDILAGGAGNFYSADGNIKVPEPATFALFGAALLGCALFLGRRRSPNV